MNTIQAKRTININSYLQSNGYQPVRSKGNSSWYLSPFRTEKKASFVVNDETNTFIDWGSGQRGTIIDLIMILFNTDISEALKILSRCKPSAKNMPVLSFNKQDIQKPAKFIPGKIEKISHSRVKSYLEKRGIKKNIWGNCEFLFQYKYPNPTASKVRVPFFYNVAWKNDGGGYELNNKNFKRCLVRKDITTIPGTANEINIFEGFFDYLSALTYFKTHRLTGTTIVLNSVMLLDRIAPALNKDETFNVYLDNDKTGELAFSVIDRNFKKVINKSKLLYPNFKDFNEFLVSTLVKTTKS